MSTLTDLRNAIARRLAIVADRAFYNRDPKAHLAALQNAAAETNRHAAALRATMDPTLAHYLDRQSLTKALDWLDHHAKDPAR
jgi:flagellar biosynthesis chaperone FliJ